MSGQYSQRSSGVKRLQAEYRQLQRDGDSHIHAAPVADDLFDWHFTVRFDDDEGGGDFRGGVYHGRITVRAWMMHVAHIWVACSETTGSCRS